MDHFLTIFSVTHNGIAWKIGTTNDGRGMVEVAPGLLASLPIVGAAENVDGYSVRIEIDLMDGGLKAREVTVVAPDGAAPVTGSVMRGLRLGEFVQVIVESAVQNDSKQLSAPGRVLKASPRVLSTTRGREWASDPSSREALLKDVAAAFRLAELLGIPPVRYVQSLAQIPRSTAGYWIKLARQDGYLEPPRSRASEAPEHGND